MTTATIPTDLVAPLFNPATFGIGKRDKVHEILATIRRDYPLAKSAVPGFDPMWIVSRFNDVREVLRNDEVFLSAVESKTLVPQSGKQLVEQYTGGQKNILKTLVHMDGEEHARHRALTAPSFSPDGLKRLEAQIRDSAARWIRVMDEKAPEMEFASEVAFRYPLEVMMDIVGAPREDHPRILELVQWFFNFADPDLQRPGADPTDPTEVVKTWDLVNAEFGKLYSSIIADRRACPRDDIASILANSEKHGCPMDPRTMISYFLIFSSAGHDSAAATTATSMWHLAENPELLQQLRADPKLIPSFVEEAIRWTSPVQQFIRTAGRDYEMNGQTIRKGDQLYVSYLSANFDEDVFPDPFTFKVDRRPNRHITFGAGEHICVGANLARTELRIFWEMLIPRLESVELTAPARMAHSEFVCGPKEVPIRYKLLAA
ncbi:MULTISPECIES: cytochrome P450 [Alphaproteobacteria]|uniref:Cytochrome P450 n=2 Tax=Alphaproteobacteria TaxID=28211 RepID=A0A512HNV3_9HYPH|nr:MULTISPECIES: cytochrome P450 [Alphaproteobacteria]GEO87070.1 cytochrome P450 [Ciceribacter naphthalenivorans]GLR23144.1 cytochrome P450 [Ciceribacter naphthalenivorans]GLT06000.1 cytochrome P450 [Sphingomonas psychrolutea]